MNALIYAINEINHQIPSDLLEIGFTIDDTPETVKLNSIDDKILNKLIRKRVLLDTNLIGGVELIIPLSDVKPTITEYNYTVYNIPPEITLGREIISALSITYSLGRSIFNNGNSLAFSNINNANNSLTAVTQRISNSVAPEGSITNAHLELIGHNTILVYVNYVLLKNHGLRVIIENDSNLNNIQPRSYKAFSYLCVLATKAYLYNKLIIPVNNGLLAFGQDLGIFKDILESYSGAEEEYRTYIEEKMSAILFMNDTTRMNRFVKSMVAPDI